jgi:predicted aspartyl protease
MVLLSVALAAAIEIPYRRLESGHLVVEVSVEGQAPVPFVVDTGASVTVLSPATWQAAGGDPERGLKLRAAGAGGVVQDVRLLSGVDLVVAGFPIRVGAAAMVDLGEGLPFGGLIGRDILRRYVVEVDDTRSTLTLHPHGTVLELDGVLLRMRRARGGLTTVELQIGAVGIPALFDLGAAGTILNTAAAALPGVTELPDCGDHAVGADQSTIHLGCVSIAALALGDLALGETLDSTGLD